MKAVRVLPALALTVALGPGVAGAVEYDRLLADRSTLGFTFRQMNVPVDGKFRKLDGSLRFDPAAPASARIRVDVELASIDAGSDEANGEVAGAQWFDTRHFPVARFVVDPAQGGSIRSLGGERYEFRGRLSIKGRTRDVTIPARFQTQGTLGVFDGGLVIKRADFGIGEGPWADFDTVANEIPVHFRLVVGTDARR
jgi:polyisoprenoid-binding protein YceI